MNMKSTTLLTACLTGALLTVPASSFAGANSGFYLGAGVGDASINNNNDFDESDSAYKVLAGYNIGFIPFVDFAVEGSYVDFGSPGNATDTVDATAFDAFGLVGLNFGPVGIFAKAGAVSWDLKSSGGSESGTDPAYGIGARFQLFAISVRAEYEVFEFGTPGETVDAEMVSVSATFTF